MSLSEFWINVRSAFRVPEARRLDAPAIEAALRESSDWLAVETVDGFDEADFPFLTDADRLRLKESVDAFRRFAATRKFRRPPTPETVEAAVPVFREIVRLLEFDRYDSPEALRLGKRIEKAVRDDEPPPELVGFHIGEGPDHTGSPTLWIMVLLSDETAASDERFLESAREIRPWLFRIARRAAPEHFPNISFRPAAEEFEVVEAP